MHASPTHRTLAQGKHRTPSIFAPSPTVPTSTHPHPPLHKRKTSANRDVVVIVLVDIVVSAAAREVATCRSKA